MAENRPTTILNVNDREAARYLITTLLKRAGFTVLEAVNGTQALQATLRERPDLIVLDVLLPDMSGYEVCRQLKASPETASIPVLLSSAAYANTESKVEGLESGADAYLAQPFEAAELIATARALLRIRQAERDAQEALKLRDEFLTTASHELRTPLTSVHLQLQLLHRLVRGARNVPVRPEELLPRLDVALRRSQYLAQLIDSLLDVSRIASGRYELRSEEVDLTAVAREVVDRFAEEAVRERCTPHIHAPHPVVGLWDPLRIEQIVANLFSNAIKYGQGGRIDLSVSSEGGNAILIVRDEGMGIAPEDQARIFDRFERAARAPNQTGFGVGLWIVRQVVLGLGGHISVTSEKWKGSTFRVELPRQPNSAANATLPAASSSSS